MDGFSIILILKIIDFFFLRSKSPCILLNKNIALIKTKPNRKWKIPHTFLERRTFSSHKNRKLKIKL